MVFGVPSPFYYTVPSESHYAGWGPPEGVVQLHFLTPSSILETSQDFVRPPICTNRRGGVRPSSRGISGV